MGVNHSVDSYCVPVEGTKKNSKETCVYRNPNSLKELTNGPED